MAMVDVFQNLLYEWPLRWPMLGRQECQIPSPSERRWHVTITADVVFSHSINDRMKNSTVGVATVILLTKIVKTFLCYFTVSFRALQKYSIRSFLPLLASMKSHNDLHDFFISMENINYWHNCINIFTQAHTLSNPYSVNSSIPEQLFFFSFVTIFAGLEGATVAVIATVGYKATKL